MKRTTIAYRLFISAIAFVVGILTVPIASVLWPLVFAWTIWNESENEEE